MKKTILFLTAALLLFSCSPALADEGQDYGYWCTECAGFSTVRVKAVRAAARPAILDGAVQ